VSNAPLDPESGAAIAYLDSAGWGTGTMRIDFSIEVLEAAPNGAQLRLRADFPLQTLPSEGARTVARAMQRYRMLLADGGQIALTTQSDRFTRAGWAGLLGPRDLEALRPRDFEMVEGGARIPLTLDCVRNP
jgi:serine/threonine-protein kinase